LGFQRKCWQFVKRFVVIGVFIVAIVGNAAEHWVAVLVAALMLLAAARLADALDGIAGRVAWAAGCGVAVLYAGYYAGFGAGAVVAGEMLGAPGPGVGEGGGGLRGQGDGQRRRTHTTERAVGSGGRHACCS
jgi:hypothetical protein